MVPGKLDTGKLDRDYELFLDALEDNEDIKQSFTGVEGLELEGLRKLGYDMTDT